MGRLFDLDSPVMNFLNKLADLIWLNILTAVCCLPVITVGASMTALNYVVLKMVRNEEGYVTKSFFKSFKQNFRQATVIWLILLAVIAILAGDFMIVSYSVIRFPSWLRIVLIVLACLLLFSVMHLFPVLSRFENTVMHTYKNSLLMGILALPKTLAMMVIWVIPPLIAIFLPQILPIVVCLGISGPAILCALLYNKTFKRFEPEEEEKPADEWTIEEEEVQPAEGMAEEGRTEPEE